MQNFLQLLIIIFVLKQNFNVVKGCKFFTKYIYPQESEACKNFHEYACSGYNEENTNPNYGEITQKLDYEFNKKLLKVIERSHVYAYDNKKQNYKEKFILYWQSCKNETRRVLKKYFEEIRPSSNLNWPLLEQKELWFETNKTFDLWSLLGQLQSYGLNNVLIKQDINRNKDHTLDIWLEPVFIPIEGSLPEENTLKILLKALDIQRDVEPIITELKATDFLWRNITENYFNVDLITGLNFEDLALLYPKLNLQLFLKQLVGKQELENISNITIENPKYFEYLNDKNWTEEELLQLTNYLMIKFLYYLAEDSTAEFTPLECLKDLRNKFDLALNVYYYHNIFIYSAQQFQTTLNIMRFTIKKTMSQHLDDNYLKLSYEQINFLQKKLEAIKLNVGNLPDNFYDDNSINAFYQDLPNLDQRNYYKNHLLLLKHRFSKTLLYTQNQTHFIVSSNSLGGISSPFYVPQQNMVVIPFGSFQKPFFDYSQTYLEQLSLFGFILAHELTHAIDTTGLQYDHNGLPLNNSMGIMENVNFIKSLNCMQQQKPTEDIDERIADLFAVRVAYNTYRNYYAYNEKNWQRKFFMNLSQFFCGKDDIKYIDHDADSIRLQQIVKNFPEFAFTFRCHKNSNSYPKKICRLY